MSNPIKKSDVISLMHRIGIAPEKIAEAERGLPDPVDLDRDGNQLARLGLTTDYVWDEMGGSL